MTMPIYDTKRVQIAMLCEYMQNNHGMLFCGDGFTEAGILLPNFVTFNEAVKMFNNAPENVGTKVKLNYSKRAKQIKCTNHVLNFGGLEGEEVAAALKGLRHISSGKIVRPKSTVTNSPAYEVALNKL